MYDELFKTLKVKDVYEADKFKDMALKYLEDIPENFYLDQFGLEKKIDLASIGVTYQDWIKFLTHPPFSAWKSKQIAMIAAVQADKALSKSDVKNETVNALRMQKEMLEEHNKKEKPTIIVIPTDLFFTED